jgi:8-oxo-dGTP pyrophosphatase MutT (NUDIX family)
VKQKKAKTLARKGQSIRQVGALAYRRRPSGIPEIVLVTSRGTSRFVIPKGWRMKGKLNSSAAALEARQEAGVVGRVSEKPIGSYRYWKRLRTLFVPVTVVVYALEVESELPHWSEKKQRRRQWLSPEEAASLVDEPELASLIVGFQVPEPA